MKFWINKIINSRLSKPFFKWYEVGILGCGVNSVPWIDLSNYVPWPDNQQLIVDEILKEIKNQGHISAGGHCLIPEHVNGVKFPTHYQFYCEEYIPKNILEQLNTKFELDDYVYKNLSNPIWFSALNVKFHANNYWQMKHKGNSQWDNRYHLPLFRSWLEEIERAMFQEIGRIVIYSNLVNSPVYIHRDYPVENVSSQSHFVILQIANKKRKTFVYDEILDKKIYIESSAYMFNELDCHGVDAEVEQNFTIRIDGLFQDWLSAKLGFIDYNVFSYRSKSYQKLTDLKIYEP